MHYNWTCTLLIILHAFISCRIDYKNPSSHIKHGPRTDNLEITLVTSFWIVIIVDEEEIHSLFSLQW